MYKGSFGRVTVGKATTGGFKFYKTKSLKEFAEMALTRAWIPVTLKGGWREYESVTEVHDWLRFDCDMKGEMETIISILDMRGLAYMCLPSTNYHPKKKNYKWHISVPTTGADNDVTKYKWQMRQAMAELGITLHDTRATEVCVQNFNPYQNGKNVAQGKKYMRVVKGEKFKLKKAPKNIKYSALTKTKFNGKGIKEVINKKVVYATPNLELLAPDSGIKLKNVGWITLGDLNLDIGGIIGGLSCPRHNQKHQKGGHECGYAFATMDEGGDIWVKCTGAECKGVTCKVDMPDYGAMTKLSDLHELRKLISLCGFDFNKNAVLSINDEGYEVSFRWKDIFKFWDKELFWKLDMSMTEENIKKQKKLEKKKERLLSKGGDVGKLRDIDDEIDKIKLDNEYEIISKAFGDNIAGFEYFKKTYPRTEKKMPHEVYIATLTNNIINYVERYKQFKSIEYKVDPFLNEVRGEIKDNNLVLTQHKVIPYRLAGKPDKKLVKDYKKHNPYLDDILEMVMAQRFGADRKTSYLWIKADSNWGKTFLFEGMFKGVSCTVNETELKGAVKGAPSGLDPNTVTKSSFLFFDEFKGAVSEIKNIATEMQITPKFKDKYTVPVYMKIFASAEEVKSLSSSLGMEAQFANRFLYIEATGSLLERELYKNNMEEYKRSVRIYINHKMLKLQDEYRTLGREVAPNEANKRFSKLIMKYTIKRTEQGKITLEDTLPEIFEDWLIGQSENPNIESIKKKDYTKYHIFNKDIVIDQFINEAISENQRGMVRHKSYRAIIGSSNNVTYNTSIRNKALNKVKKGIKVVVTTEVTEK